MQKLAFTIAIFTSLFFQKAIMAQDEEFDGLSEKNFHSIIKIFHELYAPKILIHGSWADTNVNAYALREKGIWSVNVSGGIARAKKMTKDSFALIICHEIGHHMGGEPKSFLYDGWSSAEGQADYWATKNCLKNYYGMPQNAEIETSKTIPEKIIKDCTTVYKKFTDFKICIQSSLAAIDYAHFLNALPNVKIPIDLETPDLKEVKGTNVNDYPRPQCRFDTLYQGALCNNLDLNCNTINKFGQRPRCWYKPD